MPQDAVKALASANDKLLRGRKLVVTYAQQAPLDQAGLSAGKPKRPPNDTGKPTTLSLLKSVGGSRVSGYVGHNHPFSKHSPELLASSTDDKIAKMEAKLRQLEQSSASGSALPGHPSLPQKPVGTVWDVSSGASAPRMSSTKKRPPSALPSLPLRPSSTSLPDKPVNSILPQQQKKTSPLAGVVLKKRKDA